MVPRFHESYNYGLLIPVIHPMHLCYYQMLPQKVCQKDRDIRPMQTLDTEPETKETPIPTHPRTKLQ